MSFPSATGAVSCHLNPGAGSEASQPHRRRPEPPHPIPTPRFRIGCQRSQLEGWALEISSCFMVSRCRKFRFLGSVEAAVRKPRRTPPPRPFLPAASALPSPQVSPPTPVANSTPPTAASPTPSAQPKAPISPPTKPLPHPQACVTLHPVPSWRPERRLPTRTPSPSGKLPKKSGVRLRKNFPCILTPDYIMNVLASLGYDDDPNPNLKGFLKRSYRTTFL